MAKYDVVLIETISTVVRVEAENEEAAAENALLQGVPVAVFTDRRYYLDEAGWEVAEDDGKPEIYLVED